MTAKPLHITLLTGTRPNLVKAYAFIKSVARHNVTGEGPRIILRHIFTGQHYDDALFADMLRDLGLDEPDLNLAVGSGSAQEQKIKIYMGLDRELKENRPDYFVVFGDVNSTMVGAICADHIGIPVVHIESGLRSHDLSMPEEFNRICTDRVTAVHFTTLESAGVHLTTEGIDPNTVFHVGNLMIDTLVDRKAYFSPPAIWDTHSLKPGHFLLATIHRQSNVNTVERIIYLLDKIMTYSRDLTVVLPAHPRTLKMLQSAGYNHDRLLLTTALPYLSFNYLVMHAKGIITDSGGISEETTFLNIPCITLRHNTERPETVTLGTNVLCDESLDCLPEYMNLLFAGDWKQAQTIPLWDGHSADRIVDKLLEWSAE